MENRAMKKRVAVIGAGVAGLTSIKWSLEEGLDVVCFEKSDYIGGGWFFTDKYQEGQGAAVWKSIYGTDGTHLIGFSDFHFPDDAPVIFSHDEMWQYLCDYATHFNLRQHIKLNTKVSKVDKAHDYTTSGCWDITYATEGTSEQTETFDFVMVASGFHCLPIYPELIGGIEDFKGEFSHTLHYRDSGPFVGKTVVVVGNFISAGDIAVDIAKVAKKVYIAVGRGTCLIPSLSPAGVPVSYVLFSRAVNYLSQTQGQNYINAQFKKYLPNMVDHHRFGIPSHSSSVGVPVMINDVIPTLIIKQRISLKGYIRNMTQDGVIFENGERIEGVDNIVWATGYNPSYPFLDKSIITEKTKDMNVYKEVWPVSLDHPTLAMIGCIDLVGSICVGTELQARWATSMFIGQSRPLPSRDLMMGIVNQTKEKLRAAFGNGKWKHFHAPYCDSIAEEIGARPKVLKSLLLDRNLGNRLLLGPMYPVHYRIWGRHALPGAREEYLRQCKLHSDAVMKVTDISTYLRLSIIVAIFSVAGGTYLGWKVLRN